MASDIQHPVFKAQSSDPPFMQDYFSRSILIDLASGPKNGADQDDVDLNQKLEAWEKFYNLNRRHGAFAGKTPYEVLRTLLN
ncbi:MAG: hypothetical protein IIA60_11595 [Candidatus Marinimicrobia bacterium]|nr:hypothetical protein [Candidatus Neomarinimicrobiota bacterium]